MELVKDPVPVPSLVELALGIDKPGDVPQRTPRAVTAAELLVTFPPDVAVKLPMDEAEVVVTVGTGLEAVSVAINPAAMVEPSESNNNVSDPSAAVDVIAAGKLVPLNGLPVTCGAEVEFPLYTYKKS